MHFDFQRDEWQSYGRNRWGLDADSTAEQVESAWKANEGLAFVERCQLRELNIGEDVFDDVIEELASKEAQAQLRRTWRGEILNALDGILKAEPESAVWKAKIREDVERRNGRNEYGLRLEQLIADGGETFRTETPDRVVREVSRAIASFGLVPAIGLIDYTIGHCEQAASQLEEEARRHAEEATLWTDYYNNVFNAAPKKIDVTEQAGRELAAKAITGAAVYPMRKGQQRVADLGSKVLGELISQILEPLKAVLLQNREQVATADVSDWPGKQGVPEAFRPPPLEQSLIPVDSWPELFVEKVSDAAAQDPGNDGWETKVRGMIAGGGFTGSIGGGNVQPVSTALALAPGSEWRPSSLGGDRQKPQFVTSLDLNDIEGRASKWLLRDGTATEQLLNTDLRSFLDATDESSNPIVDHTDRMNRFDTALAAVLQSAQPLINMPIDVLQAVHPGVTGLRSTTLIPEPLPLPDGHPARARAEERVRSFLGNDATDELVDSFFTNSGNGRESVTFVSRLAGAVHPAAVASLVTPISAKWRSGGADPATFWKNRRSRPLKESIPVHEPVRRAMIRGWYIGRFLGLIPDPTPNNGFEISTVRMPTKSNGDSDVATMHGVEAFPWPLLRGRIDTGSHSVTAWLPAILESLSLAFALFPGNQSIIQGYEELYLLGQTNRELAAAGQPMRYTSVGAELGHWLTDGSASCFNVNPQDHADNPTSRKAKAIACFKSYQGSVEKKNANDLQFDPDHFWNQPFGSDLFPEIIHVLRSELIPAIESWTEVDDAERG